MEGLWSPGEIWPNSSCRGREGTEHDLTELEEPLKRLHPWNDHFYRKRVQQHLWRKTGTKPKGSDKQWLCPSLKTAKEKIFRESVTHSITANNVPHWEGFTKIFIHSTWHLFTTPIICKREIIFTWLREKKQRQRSGYIILTGIN